MWRRCRRGVQFGPNRADNSGGKIVPPSEHSDADWRAMAPDICTRLLGDASSRSGREWRWGRKGSFRLKVDTGTWNDFEAGEGGECWRS